MGRGPLTGLEKSFPQHSPQITLSTVPSSPPLPDVQDWPSQEDRHVACWLVRGKILLWSSL